MGALFRSEEMVLCQLFLQNESAYNSISNLGELGLVQFRDTNPSVNAFQRKFINEVRRCDEMERKLRFVEKEIKKEGIPLEEPEGNSLAPQPKELIDLETTFEKLENEVNEENTSAIALKRTYCELVELKYILIKAVNFFQDQESQTTTMDSMDQSALVPNEMSESTQLGFLAGVILKERVPAFERMLWRACRGNVFLKQEDMEELVEEPETGEKVSKIVFMLFFQGEVLKNRVIKICEGFHATLYPCPDVNEERESMLDGVKTRIEDLSQIMNQTQDHLHKVLANAAKSLTVWMTKVYKVKAIYYAMNMFNQDVTKECLIAECWCSVRMLSDVESALQQATEESGSNVPSIVNRMVTKEKPPTYNVLNKFTTGFQNIVDAYGVATYTEVNPAPFTLITFPFLFAVMFGDLGHGLIMALFALWMVIREKTLIAEKSTNEIWTTMFGGRYIILLMGVFSMYTGFIYNDIFSKSINIFGTGWRVPQDVDVSKTELKTFQLDPDGTAFNSSLPYPVGIDPIWQAAANKILFLNSYKMKVSIIFGVCQMTFGVVLSVWNHNHFGRRMNIIYEFIPQIVFLLSIFGYLCVLIFFKWIKYGAHGSFCSPSLLITLINMFLYKYVDDPCYLQQMYKGQKAVQTLLVLVAFICVPWMLLFKPIMQHCSKRKSKAPSRKDDESGEGNEESDEGNQESGEEEKDEGFGDLFIHQAIHTIEYCLGSISHTASYLRLWALSLAHAELSEVLWSMVLKIPLGMKGFSAKTIIMTYVIFAAWASLTIGILLIMEGLSAFLHALRLHWVEFQSKFYDGQGHAFVPFSFKRIIESKEEI